MSYFTSSRTYTLPKFCLCSQTSQCGYNVAVLSPEHEGAPRGPSFESHQCYPPSLCCPAERGTEAWLRRLLASTYVGDSGVLQRLYHLSSFCTVISCLPVLPLPQKGTFFSHTNFSHIYNTLRDKLCGIF